MMLRIDEWVAKEAWTTHLLHEVVCGDGAPIGVLHFVVVCLLHAAIHFSVVYLFDNVLVSTYDFAPSIPKILGQKNFHTFSVGAKIARSRTQSCSSCQKMRLKIKDPRFGVLALAS